VSARWQRREFLHLALVQLGAWPLASALGCGDSVIDAAGDAGGPLHDVLDAGAMPFEISATLRDQIATLDRSALLEIFFEEGDRALVADVGMHYLQTVAPDGDDTQVRAALQAAMSVLERSTDDAVAIEALAAAITAEFSARNVADLEGWTLAPTELALCALLWIAEGARDAGDASDAGGPADGAADAR
jgi:hypothetical protein